MKINIEKIVSRETLDKFILYKESIVKWNRNTGLIQIDSLDDFENRHVLDSLQLVKIINSLNNQNVGICLCDYMPTIESSQYKILDIGSGAGFPGMILAICGFKSITLCESNSKKCIFLEEISRLTLSPVLIINDRAETIKEKYDIVTSRACADLTTLLELMKNVSRETITTGLFHKGKTWFDEVEKAQITWEFEYIQHKSTTCLESVILEIKNLKKK